MATLASIIGYGVAASRPAAGTPGALYYASDTDVLSRDNGSTWNTLSPGGGGGATTYAPTGLTGATAVSRYAGATTGGAPASGTFAVGDFIVDRNGAFWLCVTAGSPGTWVKSGAGGPQYVGKVTAAGGETSLTVPVPTGAFRNIILKALHRSAGAASSFLLQFNGDTTAANYFYEFLSGNAATPSSGVGNAFAGQYAGAVNASTDGAGIFGFSQVAIFAAQGATHKAVLVQNGYVSSNAAGLTTQVAGRWASTAAITGIVATLGGTITFAAGSEIAVYVERDI